jgi:hypothetical protein
VTPEGFDLLAAAAIVTAASDGGACGESPIEAWHRDNVPGSRLVRLPCVEEETEGGVMHEGTPSRDSLRAERSRLEEVERLEAMSDAALAGMPAAWLVCELALVEDTRIRAWLQWKEAQVARASATELQALATKHEDGPEAQAWSATRAYWERACQTGGELCPRVEAQYHRLWDALTAAVGASPLYYQQDEAEAGQAEA